MLPYWLFGLLAVSYTHLDVYKRQMKYTDGLVVENVRLRNNLADGVNFAQGTKNSIVRNSSIRGNGDDGLASWSSIADGTESAVAENNKFLHKMCIRDRY